MSVNKNALIRFRVLDRCFSNPGKRFFIEDLLEACNNKLREIDPDSKGIQRRQLFDDINYMESEEGWSAEINRISWGKRKFYRYNDLNFSISKQPLNEAEMELIKAAMDIASRFSGMPQFQWIGELAHKIDPKFISNVGSKPIIAFDNNLYLKGVERLTDLYYSILYKKTIKIYYQPFNSVDILEYIIYPYYLKQYNNRWFLLGLNSNTNSIITLAIDRIKDIEEVAIMFLENNTYDFEEYFEDIIGVTKHNLPIQKIVLSFSRETAPYIITKPLHGSQKIVRNSTQGMTISIEVIPNYELEALLLSFGENVEVILPATLREKIYLRMERALRRRE